MADYFSVCLFTAQRNQHAAFKCSPMQLIRGKGHRQCQQFHFYGFSSSHHPGKAISWVIATALFATACFCTSASTMRGGRAAHGELQHYRSMGAREQHPKGWVPLRDWCVAHLRDHIYCEPSRQRGKARSALTDVMFNIETVKGIYI